VIEKTNIISWKDKWSRPKKSNGKWPGGVTPYGGKVYPEPLRKKRFDFANLLPDATERLPALKS
jgi:hypothetical protein